MKPTEEEQPAFALLSRIFEIKNKFLELPKFKLEKLSWIVIDDKALFLRTPLLSIPGKTFWLKDDHLLPIGFDFEFKNLSSLLQRKYNSEQKQYL